MQFKTAYIKASTDNRGFVMSSNQSKQVKKPNQHLENLIKADGYMDLPYWYRAFIHTLMVMGQLTNAYHIYAEGNHLRGYIRALFNANVITCTCGLYDLIEEAEKFAIDNNLRKAA